MPSTDEKAVKELFDKHRKRRITIIKRTRNERRQIKKFLRNDGFTDIVEYSEFAEAWNRLHLSTTCILIFSVARPEGLDFLHDLIESTRFKKTPLIIFTNKINEHPKLFAHEEVITEWAEAPMNSLKVEVSLYKTFQRGITDKSLVADDSASLEHFTKGMDAMRREGYEEAKEFLRLSIKENPEFIDAYAKMTETLIELQDNKAAKRVIERASSLEPDNPKLQLLQARIAADTQSKEAAINALDQSVSKRPRDLLFIIEIGNIALNKGWIEEAIRYYEMAKSLDPDLVHAYNRLGIAYSRAGRFDEALGMYENALKVDEKDAGIYFNIGMTHCRMGKEDKALVSFKKSNRLDPELSEPKKWIAKLESKG